VLIVEEGYPDTLSKASIPNCAAPISKRACTAGRAAEGRRIHQRSPAARDRDFIRDARPAGLDAAAIMATADRLLGHKGAASRLVGELPPRPPNFCTGCPERPVFAASAHAA